MLFFFQEVDDKSPKTEGQNLQLFIHLLLMRKNIKNVTRLNLKKNTITLQ